MNADIRNMLKVYEKRSLKDIIQTNKGKLLSNKEAREYLSWGIINGHKDLKSMPEFEDIVDQLIIE